MSTWLLKCLFLSALLLAYFMPLFLGNHPRCSSVSFNKILFFNKLHYLYSDQSTFSLLFLKSFLFLVQSCRSGFFLLLLSILLHKVTNLLLNFFIRNRCHFFLWQDLFNFFRLKCIFLVKTL